MIAELPRGSVELELLDFPNTAVAHEASTVEDLVTVLVGLLDTWAVHLAHDETALEQLLECPLCTADHAAGRPLHLDKKDV